MMTLTNFNEQLNLLINKALGNLNNNVGSTTVITQAAIASALTTASTNVTALSGVTHSRAIQDHGPNLNPSLPGN